MSKKLLVILFICFVVCIIGCKDTSNEKNQNTDESSQKESVEHVQYPIADELTVQIKEGTLTNEQIYLDIYNNSNNYMYQLGPRCGALEKKINGQWKRLEYLRNDIVYHNNLYDIRIGKSIEYLQNWEQEYGNLSSGEYRLTKTVMRVAEDGTKENYCFKIEFSL